MHWDPCFTVPNSSITHSEIPAVDPECPGASLLRTGSSYFLKDGFWDVAQE